MLMQCNRLVQLLTHEKELLTPPCVSRSIPWLPRRLERIWVSANQRAVGCVLESLVHPLLRNFEEVKITQRGLAMFWNDYTSLVQPTAGYIFTLSHITIIVPIKSKQPHINENFAVGAKKVVIHYALRRMLKKKKKFSLAEEDVRCTVCSQPGSSSSELNHRVLLLSHLMLNQSQVLNSL